MCALGVSSTALACGTEAFSLTGIFDQDVVQLSCSDSPAPQPDLSRTIPLSIRTGYSCPSLVVQIGCNGSYCQGYGYPGAQQTIALAYPVLTPVARLRVRVLSSGSTSTQWTAFFGGDVIFLDQVNSQWLEVAVPQDANQIDLRASCMAEPLLEKIYVVVYNYCEGTNIIVSSPIQQPISLPYYSGAGFQTYLDIPRVSIDSGDGRNLCVFRYSTGSTQCGASPYTIVGLEQNDQYEVRCR